MQSDYVDYCAAVVNKDANQGWKQELWMANLDKHNVKDNTCIKNTLVGDNLLEQLLFQDMVWPII